MVRLEWDSMIRSTLRNPWVWLIAACLVLFAMRSEAATAWRGGGEAMHGTTVAARMDPGRSSATPAAPGAGARGVDAFIH